MSIYPVPLQKWFPHPKKHGDSPFSDQHDVCKLLVKDSRCHNCGQYNRWSKAWGYHAICYGFDEIWCSKECVYGPKKKKKATHKRKKKLRGKRAKMLHYGTWNLEINSEEFNKLFKKES